MLNVKREEWADGTVYVKVWPDSGRPYTAAEAKLGEVCYWSGRFSPKDAREQALAILRACDEAEALEREVSERSDRVSGANPRDAGASA